MKYIQSLIRFRFYDLVKEFYKIKQETPKFL